MTEAIYPFEDQLIRKCKLERLRDEFAMHAMESIIIRDTARSWADTLKEAYEYADAALKAREINHD